MRLYIIITGMIHDIGGGQQYTAGKIRYLERCGWEVWVFSTTSSKDSILIHGMERFRTGGIVELEQPPFMYKREKQNEILTQMVSCLSRFQWETTNEVVIESHTDTLAFWGEMLAARIKARHIIIPTAEEYNGRGQDYASYQDYFWFKFRRNEIIARGEIINRLFQGEKVVPEEQYRGFQFGAEADMVQEICNPQIEALERKQYNILMISRMEKEAIPGMLHGIHEFACAHQSETIQLIIVGNAEARAEELRREISTLPNVELVLLGVLIPVPRQLFRKADIVLAISQTARFASYENVPTIVPFYEDGRKDRSAGVLGYDTNDAYHGVGTFPKQYADVLEDVLVNKRYLGQPFKMPPQKSADYWYAVTLEIMKQASSTMEYSIDKISKPRWDRIFKLYLRLRLRQWFPFLIPIKRKFFPEW